MNMKMKKTVLLTVLFIGIAQSQQIFEEIYVSELFSARIEPMMFNWTFQGLGEQFNYRPTLEGHPDLPSWIRYQYSNEYHAGFLYGTPPEKISNSKVSIEIIALNKQTYETRRVVITLAVSKKLPPTNIIQMKIDNLNWVHMMDPGRIENLKNIFRKDLWQESRADLHIIFMDSAIKMGARKPMKPQEREGVVVHLGSRAEFSERLMELHEEIKPLYKISSCTYKRTSVQTIFENSGFKLDWCAFKLYGQDEITAMPHHPNAKENYYINSKKVARWDAPSKAEIPDRNYSDEFALSFAIPGIIFALLFSVLTVILCFQHDKLNDEYSENYFNFLFSVCTKFIRPEYKSPPSVQMVQYSETDHVTYPTTTLKSLKEAPMTMEDGLSMRSQSPCESFYEGSPRVGNNYMRPKPPPYKPTSSSNSSTMKKNGGADI